MCDLDAVHYHQRVRRTENNYELIDQDMLLLNFIQIVEKIIAHTL